MKHFNKFLFLLAIFGLSTISVNAQFSGGSGTASLPYLIGTDHDLRQLADLVNAGNTSYNDRYYELIDDIDLSENYGPEYNNGKGWIPIGNIANHFYGSFNGKNHKIYGLWINDPELDYAGLFGYCVSPIGTIKNLGVYGSVVARYITGGIVGSANGGGISLDYCIENCFFQGNVEAKSSWGTVGGIVGVIDVGKIKNCYTTGTVKGYIFAGGITGSGVSIQIISCYTTSTISGDHIIGGITPSINSNCAITGCAVFSPSIKGVSDVGRVIGSYNNGSLLLNVAWDGMLNADNNTNWTNIGGSNLDGENISKENINNDGSIGGRFTTTDGWTIENGKLPGLFGETVKMPGYLLINPFEGKGTAEDPYRITTISQLETLAKYVNLGYEEYSTKHYKLMNDLLMNDLDFSSHATGWIPIGNSNTNCSFRGTFDGNFMKIKGLKIITSGLKINTTNGIYYLGLFGYVSENAQIKNLAMENVNFNLNDPTMYQVAGAIAGRFEGTGSISNCYSTGTISATSNNSNVGGIVGRIGSVNVSNCYSTVAITGVSTTTSAASTGGIIGNKNGGASTVSHCAALNPSINCVSQGSTAQHKFGRIVGENYGTLFNNVGFNNMLNPAGETIWLNKDGDKIDGYDITIEELHADGTLNSRFRPEMGWATENGKLPGFGTPVEMPNHLKLNSVKDKTLTEINLYPNPTTGELRITNYELRIDNVEIFDVFGRKVGGKFPSNVLEGWTAKPDGVVIDLTGFSAGIYFLKITTENGFVMKKVVKQ